MISRGTPQHILRNSGCETTLHVYRNLMFCAMYNKRTADATTSHKADCASALRPSSVSQPCARGILTPGIWLSP